MLTITRSDELRKVLDGHRSRGHRIGFVPTMGNLHPGHHSLIELAREHADVVVASVFVNPTQFGPTEDFQRYPRTPEADATGLAAHGCDVLFAPTVEELYPYGAAHTVRVNVAQLDRVLEGAIRPGHFDGVATIVAKLFNHVQPGIAIFGQKDYQQLLVIGRMVRDLGFPIEIIAAPIVRERNGLAMSSRNQYLDNEQRARAGVIHATLLWMTQQARSVRCSIAQIEAEAGERLASAGLHVDYAAIRGADALEPIKSTQPIRGVALIAARLGSTRLIDNMLYAMPAASDL